MTKQTTRHCENDKSPSPGESPPLVTSASRQAARARAERYNRQRQLWSLLFGLLLIPLVLGIIWLDVGELNGDVFLSLAGFIVVTTVLAYATLRDAARSWQGILVDQYLKGDRLHLIFRTRQGKRIKLIVGSGIAGYFSPGDAVIKIKGFDYPEKLHRDGDQQLCVACGRLFPANAAQCSACRNPAIDPRQYETEGRG